MGEVPEMVEQTLQSSPSEVAPRRGADSRLAGRRGPRRLWRWLLLAGCVAGSLAAIRLPTDRYTIELGPLTLPANSGHEDIRQLRPYALKLPVDGWLRGLDFEFVDEQGERLSPRLLHHLNLIAPERRELFSQIMLRIGAFGPETRAYGLPSFIGYRLRPGDSLLVTAMVHNPTPTGYEGVRLRVHLELTRPSLWFRPRSIQPVYLDVMPPAGTHGFDLPLGRSRTSWEGRPAIAVRLLAAGAHLHRFGTALRLEDLTTGALIWEARPRIGADGEVESMPIHYFLPLGATLSPDHVYRLTAEYDNPTGKVLLDGGMGALGGIVMPVAGATWPAVARSDSVYRHDVWVTTGSSVHHHRSRRQAVEHHP